LWGWILAGWGLFNLVEGTVDHHVLGVHPVRGGPHQTWWDVGFLVLGAALLAAGHLLQRSGRPYTPAVPAGGDGRPAPGTGDPAPEQDA
ncbi:DUF2243 domain-containing protein, partial [Actinomadura sp. KC06]|uniref:DUF2243 domain-containing protein n=1 Tax=Actinomadura sp. KC06 TaxID=2530369 RepID=UPI001044BC4A